MARKPPKIRKGVGETIRDIGQSIDEAIERRAARKAGYVTPVTRGTEVRVNQKRREMQRPGAEATRGRAPSGQPTAEAYNRALQSEPYKKLPEKQKKEFRKQTLSELAGYGDII